MPTKDSASPYTHCVGNDQRYFHADSEDSGQPGIHPASQSFQHALGMQPMFCLVAGLESPDFREGAHLVIATDTSQS